jgi:hypothetical protein
LNYTAKPIVSMDVPVGRCWNRWPWRLRWCQAQRPVWTMNIVVINEDRKNPLKMVVIQPDEICKTSISGSNPDSASKIP